MYSQLDSKLALKCHCKFYRLPVETWFSEVDHVCFLFTFSFADKASHFADDYRRDDTVTGFSCFLHLVVDFLSGLFVYNIQRYKDIVHSGASLHTRIVQRLFTILSTKKEITETTLTPNFLFFLLRTHSRRAH
jgi:hypothetical protein